MRITLLVLGLAVGCKSSKPRYDGPMPVELGDCAPATVSWVSGPRPEKFSPDDAASVRLAMTATPTPAPPVDAAVAEAPQPMALDEGKMGTKPPSDDPQIARQQAIDAARAAGILGSSALVQGGAFASLTATGDPSSNDTIYGGLLGNEAGETNGGFGYGRAGFGPGGGTGWGTIGTGRYGTISGNHTGIGYGRGHGSVPTISIGQPDAQGDLDKAIIRRYIKRNIQKIQYCYEKQLLSKPKLSGTVTSKFFIETTGQVKSSTATGVDPEVSSCVAAVIKDIEFPKPKGGGGVQVSYPFTFHIAGDDNVKPKAAPDPGAGSGSAAGSGSDAGSAAAPPPPAPPPPPPPVPDKKPDGIDRTLFSTVNSDPKYHAGLDSPLSSVRDGLADCFRIDPKHAGVMVLQLGYDPTGAVVTAVANGVDDEDTRDCVVALAKTMKRTRGGPPALRCSVAFGKLPVAELPTIAIAPTGMTFGGRPIAVMEDDKQMRVPALAEAIEAGVKTALASSGPVVTLHGPIAIRPDAAATMKLVNRAMVTVIGAGDDFVLVTPSGETLPPLSLPVVPVPIATGSRWAPIKHGRGGLADERVVLSILVTAKTIWVGLSRVNEFQEIPEGPDRFDKLLSTLKEHKVSAFFADRTDIEVAGDDTALYGDVLKVIEIASRAGFLEWTISTPKGLSAYPSL